MTPPSIADIVRPDEATFSDKDRDVLASFWHPVAFASEVLDKPLSRRLLDVRSAAPFQAHSSSAQILPFLRRCRVAGEKPGAEPGAPARPIDECAAEATF